MKKQLWPFLSISLCLVLFSIIMKADSIVVAGNSFFALCNIFAAVMSFKNQDK